MSNDPLGFAQAAPRSRSYDIADDAIDIFRSHFTRWAHREPACLKDVRHDIAAAADARLDDFELEIRGDRPLAD